MRKTTVPRPRPQRVTRPLPAVLLALTATLAATAPASTASARAASDLPKLVSPASAVRLPGKMVFAALVTPALLPAEQFYTDLFGWQFQNAYVGPTLFGVASMNGRAVAAIVQKPLENGRRPAWRSFLSTADLDATVQLAVRQGASVLVAPHELANLGRDALLADPQGAVFGLLASSSGDPVDTLAAPGEWIWSSLVTTDPDADAAFYKTVLGYETYDLAKADAPNHVILASQTFARATVNPMPGDHPVMHPRWISYVRVGDIATVVSRATAMNATIVVPPHEDRNGGTIAILADPAGALFGLMQWADDTVADAQATGAAK